MRKQVNAKCFKFNKYVCYIFNCQHFICKYWFKSGWK